MSLNVPYADAPVEELRRYGLATQDYFACLAYDKAIWRCRWCRSPLARRTVFCSDRCRDAIAAYERSFRQTVQTASE